MDRMDELGDDLPEPGPPFPRDEEPGPPFPSTSFAPCASPRVEPTVRQHNFVAQTHDAALHFQVLDLGRQYYVWVSAVGPKLGNLYLAIKTPTDAAPAVASLIPSTSAAGEGSAMAQRLALKLGKPVVCSCNMPANVPLLQAVAERRLLEELKSMEAEAMSLAGQGTKAGETAVGGAGAGGDGEGDGSGSGLVAQVGVPAVAGAV